MKTLINGVRLHVLPTLSFLVYLCVEGALLYGLYRVIVPQ
jgi:hypothetical protein